MRRDPCQNALRMRRRRPRLSAGVLALGCVAAWLLAAPHAFATPAWVTPVNLTEPRNEAFSAHVAADASGDATAVWFLREGNGNTVIQAASRPAGGPWQATVDISEAGAGFLSEPAVAVDAHGDVVATWSIEYYGLRNSVVQSAFKPTGDPWQAPVTVSEVPEEHPPGPQENVGPVKVAFDAEGDAIALWSRNFGGNANHESINVVQSAIRPAGGSWQAPVSVSDPGGQASEAQVALDANGDAIAVWESKDPKRSECFGEHVIQSALRPAGSTWQAPVDLSETSGACDSEGPKLAVDSAGDAVVMWRRFERVEGEGAVWLQAVNMSAHGIWRGPANVSPVVGGAGASEPEVAIDGQGNATAVWEGNINETEAVWSSTRPVGGSWQVPVDISGPGQTTEPDVTLDPAGNAIAVWRRYQGDVIQSAVRPAGGLWQPPVNVSQAGQETRMPSVASDALGNAAAVWMSSSHNGDISTEIVQSAGYAAAGPQLDDLSIPSTGTARTPVSFTVSPLSVWSTVAETRWSFGDGTSATGTSPTHTYAKAGIYEVTVESEDALGNKTRSSGSIRIAPRIETVEYKNWRLSGTLTPKVIGQPITLPEGSSFNGSGELNTETGTGSVDGTLSIPAFVARFKLFGFLPVSMGMTLTPVGPFDGTLVNSDTVVGDEMLSAPTELNLGVTSVGLLGLTIPTSCRTAEVIGLNLTDEITAEELLVTGWKFAGSATVPALKCEGRLLGGLFGQVLTALLSGGDTLYAISVTPPGA